MDRRRSRKFSNKRRRRGGASSPTTPKKKSPHSPKKTVRNSFVKMALMGSMIGIGVYLAKQGYITDEQFNNAKGSFESLKTLVVNHVGEISGHVDSVTKSLIEFVKTHLSKKEIAAIESNTVVPVAVPPVAEVVQPVVEVKAL
jgi:hypothetical protein